MFLNRCGRTWARCQVKSYWDSDVAVIRCGMYFCLRSPEIKKKHSTSYLGQMERMDSLPGELEHQQVGLKGHRWISKQLETSVSNCVIALSRHVLKQTGVFPSGPGMLRASKSGWSNSRTMGTIWPYLRNEHRAFPPSFSLRTMRDKRCTLFTGVCTENRYQVSSPVGPTSR